MQSWFQNDTTEIYSTYNEGKSAVAVRFARTLKTKIYKRITLVPKNGYIDNLHRMFNKCYNTYHRAIKVKPINAEDNSYIHFGKEVNDKDPKFKINDHVRISKYKKHFCYRIFSKEYTPDWSEKIFVIKITAP